MNPSRPSIRTRSALQRRLRPACRISGVALIEVLVAILLFVLGVLGLVGLQSSMTHAQTESKMRADAVYLANEAMGRMWTDVTNIALYDGGNCATQTRCKEWQEKVGHLLPQGTGSITVDTTTGDVAVTVAWTLPNGESHKHVSQTTITKAAS